MWVIMLIEKNICTVSMLPVGEGDCFYIEFELSDCKFTMLIDCGTTACWNSVLKPFLDGLIQDGKTIDILLITHIDSDHIGGALKLCAIEEYRKIVKSVWFNGLHQIINNATSEQSQKTALAYKRLCAAHQHNLDNEDGPISARQACTLSSLLRQHGIAVNAIADGNAITDEIKRYSINEYLAIDFLLPTRTCLDDLRKVFAARMNQAVLGAEVADTPEGENAFENVMLDENPVSEYVEHISTHTDSIENVESWAMAKFKGDQSVTNNASIVICIHFCGKKLLFTGDAPQETLIPALQKWREETGNDLFFDVIKMPHHGSGNNNCLLLDCIDGRSFLISTDGKKHNHPSKEAIAKIICREPRETRYLYFNYKHPMFCLFSNENAESIYRYKVIPDNEKIILGGGPIEL